jgi:hypothetical protein
MIVVLLVIDQGAFGLRDDELPGRSSILATLGRPDRSRMAHELGLQRPQFRPERMDSFAHDCDFAHRD